MRSRPFARRVTAGAYAYVLEPAAIRFGPVFWTTVREFQQTFWPASSIRSTPPSAPGAGRALGLVFANRLRRNTTAALKRATRPEVGRYLRLRFLRRQRRVRERVSLGARSLFLG